MNTRTALLGFGSLCLAFSFNATAANTVSQPISMTAEGSTGYIGLTQSAGQPRAAQMGFAGFAVNGEASTMVNGQPNVLPTPAGAAWQRSDTRAMGGAPHQQATSAVMAGTPD